MKKLFTLALLSKKHVFLLVMTFCSMLCLTMMSYLEIISLGVLMDLKPKQEQVAIAELIKTKDVTGIRDGLLTQVKDYLQLNESITNLVIFLVAVAALKGISLFANRFSAELVSIRVSKDLRQSYFDHIQKLPLEFYHKYETGSLSARVVADGTSIAESINSFLTNYLQTPFAALITLGTCFVISVKLSLLIFFGLPLLALPIIFLAKRIKKIARQLQKNQESFTSVLIDFLSGIFTIKVFAMEQYSQKKYAKQNDEMAYLESKRARYEASSRPVIHLIGSVFLSAIILFGIFGLGLAVADVIVFCGSLWLFYEPIKKFADENNKIQRGVAAAERMFEVLDLKSNMDDSEKSATFQTLETSIQFDDVWFRYEETHDWILRGVSFEIKKGETVALVGSTGAGKSTIVKLLPRLYDVEKGEIRINGKALNSFSHRSLRQNIAFVPQKTFLFIDSVAENIAFGHEVILEKVQHAAKRAHADQFIQNLPQKYQTRVAEGGKNLSGGQQQRLAIARALFKENPILIMDEATSSLDSVSEEQIKLAIKELHGQVTQILIAHRLSTIDHADRIIFLEHGQVLAQGTRDELLANCPPFKLMWETMHKHDLHVKTA